MTGEVLEVPTATPVEAKTQYGPEQITLNPAEVVIKTADNLQEGLNRGVEPKKLMEGFVEGVYDWVDENIDNVNQGGNDKQPGGEPEQSDKEAKKSPQAVVPKEQVQLKETPEQQFQKAVQEHRKKYGLQADNLEGDPRFVQIKDQLMAEWFQKNPEPGQGKEELTDREKDQWRDWVNRKLAFQDTISQKAKEIYRTQYGEDFNRYQKYGVYQSLEEDPRFQSLLEAQRRRFTKIAEHSGNIQAINQAEAEAKNLFAQIYPEITKIYAIKNGELSKLIKNNESLTANDQITEPKRKILGFEREDRTGLIQRARWKENITYITPSGEKIFVKYATRQEGRRDNVSGLKHEAEIIRELEDDQIVPRVIDLKIYPDSKRGRLILENIEDGISLDQEKSDQLKNKANDVIQSTAEAHSIILKRGILLTDVNSGSYLITQKDSGIQTYLVDFELATRIEPKNKEDEERLLSAKEWFKGKDFSLNQKETNSITLEDLKKSEIHLWAKTMVEWLLGPSYSWEPIEIPPEKQEEYQRESERIRPHLIREIQTRAKKDYALIISSYTDFKDQVSEEKFINDEINRELPRRTDELLIGITLSERLKKAGIILDPKLEEFLARALSIDLEKRPSSFDDVINIKEN